MNYYSDLFSRLKLEAKNQLRVFAIEQEYKSLVASISHDITTPLGYLKFSSNILESQVKSNYDSEIKETARVIASSAIKLSKESKAITENAKTTLQNFSPKKTNIKEFFLSVTNHLKIQPINLEVNGFVLISHEAIYTYLLTHLLYALKKLKFVLTKITIENDQQKLLIHLFIQELTLKEIEEISMTMMENKKISEFDNTFSTLEANLDYSIENKSIALSILNI